MTEVRCPTCHRRAVWRAVDDDVEELEVVQEGGARRPRGAPDLAAWRTWRQSRAGELGPVVGRCTACGQPLVADGDGLPVAPPWTLHTQSGSILVSADTLLGPDGEPATDEAIDVLMQRELGERLTDQLDSRLFFVAFLLAIFALVATFWIGAAAFVVNFYLAMGSQGDFTAPFAP